MTPTPTNKLVALELDERNLDMLRDILTQLERFMGLTVESGLRLGGGTVLAMHWKHRFSTDIDLSAAEAILREKWNEGARAMMEYLRAQKEQGRIRKERVARMGIAWSRYDTGEVSLSISTRKQHDPTHRESTTGITLAPISEILEGKLEARVLTFNRLLARDAYDFCTTAEREPSLFKQMVENELKKPEGIDRLKGVINQIKYSNRRIIEGQPIIDPIDIQLAYDPWRRFVELTEPIVSGFEG